MNNHHRSSTFNTIDHFSLVFEWSITNYNSSITENTKKKTSEKFAAKGDINRKWFIGFQPKKIEKESKQVLQIKLYRSDSDEVYVQASIYLMGPSNKWIQLNTGFKGYMLSSESNILYSESVSTIAEQLLWIKNSKDVLTISAQINTYPTELHIESQNLVNDILKTVEDSTFKDVTFLINTEKFTAHKCILAARSEVFSDMFRNQMTEEISSEVVIEDVQPNIFKKMLHFIYSDEVDNLENTAARLFIAAHKYQLRKLENICIAAMKDNLNNNNVIKVLEIADVYSQEELKQKALTYLKYHIKEMKNTDEFLSMISVNPKIALELLTI